MRLKALGLVTGVCKGLGTRYVARGQSNFLCLTGMKGIKGISQKI